MADVFNEAKRSAVMSKVRSSGNKSTELKLIKLLKSAGIIGWRRNYPVRGRPDFVFIKHRVAVFVDGCFWHGHDCRNTRPSSSSDYWERKRERNIQNDIKVTNLFRTRGWTVLRIWECELKKSNEAATLEKITLALDICIIKTKMNCSVGIQ